MATLVSNCSGTEYGGAFGGVAGDQTGREVVVREWYDFEQVAVYRHPDPAVRAELARLATETAQNPHVGYDQSGRLTFRNALRKVNYVPSAITTDVETDCSACTAALIEAVGALLGIQKLYDFDTTLSTHYMDGPLQAAGFEKLTATKYTKSGDYLLAGDISLAPAKHVNIAVTNGSKAVTIVKKPIACSYRVTATVEYNIRTRASMDASAVVGQLRPGQRVKCDGILLDGGKTWLHYTYKGRDRWLKYTDALVVA